MKNILLITFIMIINVQCKNSETKENSDKKAEQKTENTNLDINNNKMNTTKQIIEFNDLFNEGSIIKFSPKELDNTIIPEQLEFKKKLELYEKQNPLIEDFDPNNLKSLINIHIYSNKDYSNIDSSWLDFFIKKYNLVKFLNNIVLEAVNSEDLEAVKIIINNGYIISKNDLIVSIERKREVDEIKNKKSEEDFYEFKNSKIDDILKLITKKYNSNKIYDKDGYTNLREGKNSSSSILAKINSGDHIEVLNNPDEEDWYLIKTKNNLEGYIHKSRIVSE